MGAEATALTSGAIAQALAEVEVDWFDLAREVRARRFRQYPGKDQKEKARQLRFLQQRGFDAEQSFAALDPPDDE